METQPLTSEDFNFCQPKQTAAAEQKNVQVKRKRTYNEIDNFDKKMLNKSKKKHKTMTCHLFVRFCRL